MILILFSISDGIEWYDLGSPIQGPQGEKGDDGADGINGINGRNGKGWTGTTIIDEREENPPNYQIRFDSDDGLGFVTDNIVGAQGIPGELEVASETNLGGIKIGRGLNILPDGTVQAGETYVTLETVPLGSDGRPETIEDKFTLDYEPFFDSWNDTLMGVQDGSRNSARDWTVSKEVTFTMPEKADGAVVYYFSSSGCVPYASPGQLVPGWCTGETKLEVEGAEFADGGRLNVPHTHNYSTISQQQGQSSSTPSVKIGLIRFARGGAEVKFTASARVTTARKANYTLGRGRVVVVAFKSGQGDEAEAAGNARMAAFVQEFTNQMDPDSDFTGFPDVSDDENEMSEAADLKKQISDLKQEIDELTVQEFPEGTTGYTTLMALRQELIDLRDLPGTADDVGAEVMRIDGEVGAIGDYTFRFEPMP